MKTVEEITKSLSYEQLSQLDQEIDQFINYKIINNDSLIIEIASSMFEYQVNQNNWNQFIMLLTIWSPYISTEIKKRL